MYTVQVFFRVNHTCLPLLQDTRGGTQQQALEAAAAREAYGVVDFKEAPLTC